MATRIETDLCVIGAGSAGLSVAAGAVQMGARVVLAEKGRMGGDCLNYGCVPSKALLAAAKAAAGTGGERFGITTPPAQVDFAAVRAHVQGVIAQIAPHDSVERFEGLGVRVLQGAARFTGPDEVAIGETRVRARRYVVAAGSGPLVPPIPGLDRVPYLTNETVFDLEELPAHLIVVGGGPIGCELGQAFRRLGARVSLVEMASILPKDDPEAVAVLRARLLAEGVELHEGASVTAVEPDGEGVAVTLTTAEGETRLSGSRLLLAAGRKAKVEDLGLEAAGIAYDRRGIKVDARLRSSNRRVFAIGDVAGEGGGGLLFTHVAGQQAGIVIRNALFRLPARFDPRPVPWVTYGDPEVAQVGLTEAVARAAGERVEVLTRRFADNDRAVAERATEGFVKAVVTPRGRILGCSIVGPGAGELILPWCLAMTRGLKIGTLASLVAAYPTRSEASKQVAGAFYAPKLFSERTRRLVRLLLKLG